MTAVVAIVEGDGEVAALPILLRRLGAWLSPDQPVVAPAPIRVRRDRFLNRDEEFRRMLLLAAAKCGAAGWILVLLDADDDCPAELGPRILERAQRVAPHRPISVVLANREFEAWFLAGAESLNGKRGFTYVEARSSTRKRPATPRDGSANAWAPTGIGRPRINPPLRRCWTCHWPMPAAARSASCATSGPSASHERPGISSTLSDSSI